MHLYLKSDRSLKKTANMVAAVALQDHQCQLRDGLNLGSGEYFKFFTNESVILLVCNDQDHLEVFVEEMAQFSYYCYVWKGGNEILGKMLLSLKAAGIECEIGNEDA
jgi:hypothetical protein